MQEYLMSMSVSQANLARTNPNEALSGLFEGSFETINVRSIGTSRNVSVAGILHESESEYPTEVDIRLPGVYAGIISLIRRDEPSASVVISIEDHL